MIEVTRCYRPKEVWLETRCPRSLVYASLENGSLRGIRRGRSWLIPGAAVLSWLEQLGEYPTRPI